MRQISLSPVVLPTPLLWCGVWTVAVWTQPLPEGQAYPAAGHVVAAVWSRIKGDGVWTSMVPFFRETKPSENEFVAKLARLEDKMYTKLEKVVSSRKK